MTDSWLVYFFSNSLFFPDIIGIGTTPKKAIVIADQYVENEVRNGRLRTNHYPYVWEKYDNSQQDFFKEGGTTRFAVWSKDTKNTLRKGDHWNSAGKLYICRFPTDTLEIL